MKLTTTDQPSVEDEKYIIDNLWKHNATFDPVDIRPLQVTVRDDAGIIVGGLVARTWWDGLDIQYLWVHKEQRKTGIGTQLMLAAENEAIKRGCTIAYVDTFNFQAQGFYHRFGYKEYGQLAGYIGKHTRYYLAKKLK